MVDSTPRRRGRTPAPSVAEIRAGARARGWPSRPRGLRPRGVYGSHDGLAHNPTVLHVLADRLAQSERRWGPFTPGVLVRNAYP